MYAASPGTFPHADVSAMLADERVADSMAHDNAMLQAGDEPRHPRNPRLAFDEIARFA